MGGTVANHSIFRSSPADLSLSRSRRLRLIELVTPAIQRHSLSALSMRQLASTCDILPSTFYIHFESKADLASECMSHYRQHFQALLVNREYGCGAERLHAFANELAGQLKDAGRICLAMVLAAQASQLAEDVRSEVRLFTQDSINWLDKSWETGVADKSIRSLLMPAEAALLLFSSIEGMMVLAAAAEDPPSIFKIQIGKIFTALGIRIPFCV